MTLRCSSPTLQERSISVHLLSQWNHWQINCARFQISSTAPNVDVAALGNRVNRRLAVEWQYRRSMQDKRHWGVAYRHQADSDFEVLAPKLDHILIDFAHSSEAVPFNAQNRSSVELEASSRSSPRVSA